VRSARDLTAAGRTLCAVFPGVDVRRDILEAARCKVVLPVGVVDAVEVVKYPVLSGFGGAPGTRLGGAARAVGESELRATVRGPPPPPLSLANPSRL